MLLSSCPSPGLPTPNILGVYYFLLINPLLARPCSRGLFVHPGMPSCNDTRTLVFGNTFTIYSALRVGQARCWDRSKGERHGLRLEELRLIGALAADTQGLAEGCPEPDKQSARGCGNRMENASSRVRLHFSVCLLPFP